VCCCLDFNSNSKSSQVKSSLVFGANGGALSKFLAGIFGIGGAARSLFLSPEYCPAFSVTNKQNYGTIVMGDLNESSALFLLLLEKVCWP